MSGLENASYAKRVLIFPFDLMSHYLRVTVLTRQLPPSAKVFIADSSRYGIWVRDAGIETFPFDHFDSGTVMQQASRFDFSWLNTKSIEARFLSHVRAIQELKPQMVIGDVAPALKMAAQFTGVQMVSLMNGYMTRHYALTRKLSRTHRAYPMLRKLPEKWAQRITAQAEQLAFRTVHQPFRKLRKQYGLPPVRDYLAELEGDLNLICDLPSLFPQKKLPASYSYTGPLLFESQLSEPTLLHQDRPARPLICLSMGSSGNWSRFRFLESPQFEDYRFIAAGHQIRPLKADHITNRDFVNLDEVLPACSLMICHGGNGTLYHGLKHGVYMLCETNHFEQEWNGDRLQQLGLGRLTNDLPDSELEQVIHAAVKQAVVFRKKTEVISLQEELKYYPSRTASWYA